MHWDVVMVHESINVLIALLLLDILLPDAKDVNPSALVVRPSKSVLVVPITLAIIEAHETTFLEHMVAPNDLN